MKSNKYISQYFVKTSIIIQICLTIYTMFTFFASDNLLFILNNNSANYSDSFDLLIIFFVGIISISINFWGVTKLPKSIGWAVWFIVLGSLIVITNLIIFSLNLIIGVLYVVGGIISLTEKNKQTSKDNIKYKDRDSIADELEKLNKLYIENVIDENEFKKAKEKLFNKKD